MVESFAGFVDVGFLRGEGAKAIGRRPAEVRPNAAAVANWFRGLGSTVLSGETFLRTYWYDGAFDPSHPEYVGQRSFFTAIGMVPGIQLRLGHLVERAPKHERAIRSALRAAAEAAGVDPGRLADEFDRHWTFRPERQQKGVDTLIALDLVRLAGRSVCTTAVLISGDRDLAEAVRATQDFGVRIIVATPNRASVASEVAQLADEVIDLPQSELVAMLPTRPMA